MTDSARRPIASPSPEQLNEMLADWLGVPRGVNPFVGPVWYPNGNHFGYQKYAPRYSSDLNEMALVEARLLAEGQGAHYYVEVKRLLTQDADERGDWHPGGDHLITADPLTRARAAVACLGLEADHD